MSLFANTFDAIMQSDADQKCSATHKLYKQWQNNELSTQQTTVKEIPEAGRPEKPDLVAPRSVKKRGINTQTGRINLMHAIAHIEFNAINLALDAVYRFQDQPEQYYSDWLKVADDEARHFQLICDYLSEHNCQYGDFPAHNGLWDMAVQTQHDIVARMALVPRVLEARGLDVTPAMIEKLAKAGDQQAANILTVIYNDEITHVEVGSRWFKHHCSLNKLPAEQTFEQLIEHYLHGTLRGPFNYHARRQAGFSDNEIQRLNDKYGH